MEAKCLCMFVVGAVAVAVGIAIASAVTRCLGGRWKVEDDCGERREKFSGRKKEESAKKRKRDMRHVWALARWGLYSSFFTRCWLLGLVLSQQHAQRGRA